MEKTSLGDFVEDADSRDEPAEGDEDVRSTEPSVEPADADGGDGGAADDAADAVEPAAPTSAWTPDGAECDCCGSAVERRFRDGDALACVDCVDW